MATLAEDDLDHDNEDQEDVTAEQEDALNVPVQERRLVTQPYDLSLTTLVDDIDNSRLLLNIAYQRKYVWDRSKASRLIESFLLNIPVPVCYFSENEDGTYEVIDGLQRIQTIYDFIKGEYALRGVSVITELEGKKFEELPVKEQRRLRNRTIRCIVITDDSHPDIKFDVFERLNTGSARLAAQELRNCIYRGPLNDFLKELAKDDSYQKILGGIRNNRMDYEEQALRFFALREDLGSYKPPLRQLLNTYMRHHRTTLPDDKQTKAFSETCQVVWDIFGADAFRLIKDGKPGAFNKALFDAIFIPLSFADKDSAREHAEDIRNIRTKLLEQQEFQTLIGRATADRTRMHGRIKTVADSLSEIGVQCDLPELPA